MEFKDIVATSGFASYALLHPLQGLRGFGPTPSEATFGLLGPSFKPERDVSGVEGKTIFVTGGNNLPISCQVIVVLAQLG